MKHLKVFTMENVAESNSPKPKWFSKSYLEDHLQKYFNNKQLSVISFDINSGSGKRDNFASSLFRLNVVISDDPNSPSTNVDVFFLFKMIRDCTYKNCVTFRCLI